MTYSTRGLDNSKESQDAPNDVEIVRASACPRPDSRPRPL